MKIQRQVFKDIALVPDGEYNLNGECIFVTGANGAGKSTFTELWQRIAGGKMPADIVRKGAESGAAAIEFEDGTIVDYSAAQGEAGVVTITLPNGQKPKTVATILRKMLGNHFDVKRDFVNAAPKARREFIASISGLKLDEFEAAIKEAETERTIKNRAAKEAEARAKGYEADLPADPVDVENLRAKETAMRAAANEYHAHNTKIQAALADAERHEAQIAALAKQIEAAQAAFEQAKALAGDLIQAMPVEPSAAELKEVQKQLDDATAENMRRAQNAALKKAYIESIAAAEQHVLAEIAVKAAREALQMALENAKFPANLHLNNSGELAFWDKNGQSILLESANDAVKTIIGLQVSYEMLGDVKACAMDMSGLDKRNRALVFTWAKSKNLQIFAEAWREEEPLKIEIVNQ